MTTQDCADVLNAALGEPMFTARFIRHRVEDGELVAVVNVRGNRRRALIDIAQADFLAYVGKHHRQLLGKIDPSVAA